MKKLNVILDETTVINFPFLARLMKRYLWVVLVIPAVVMVAGFIWYSKQNTIYLGTVPFKNTAGEGSSPTQSIVSMLGENKKYLSPSEVLSMVRSHDFIFNLATRMAKHPEIAQTILFKLTSREYETSQYLVDKCKGNERCLVNELVPRLGMLYRVVVANDNPNAFHIEVKALNAVTVDILRRALAEEMQSERINSIKHGLDAQIEISRELIKEKKKELEDNKYKELIAREETLDDELRRTEAKIQQLGRIARETKLVLERAEITITTANKTNAMLGNQDTKAIAFKKAKKLSTKIINLKRDIASLEVENAKFSVEDREIISQLKLELARTQRELAEINIGDHEDVVRIQQFVDSKNSSKENFRFQADVLTAQLKKIESEIAREKELKEKILQEKQLVMEEMEHFRPSAEYLKLLEEKLVKLQLIRSTIVSDLVFSENLQPVMSFRLRSRSKIFAFSLMFSLFTIFIIVTIIYLFDNRIYDEYELRRNFSDLNIIGNTPDFE